MCEQGVVGARVVVRCASTGESMQWLLPGLAGVAQNKPREWGEGLPWTASAVAHAAPLHTTKGARRGHMM